MSLKLIDEYQKALNAVYDHVGFTEDWVICPLEDSRGYVWYVEKDDEYVKFADTIEQFFSNGDYYQDKIYTQRFYNKWVYEGEDFTMIFCNPGVDGMKYFKLFDNKKRIIDLTFAERKIKLKELDNKK